ncbi:hypothetical protein [Variovorax arabinosiphilus]|uniref:hypothetical protein n=1 Tax=Variovorax arabinosiphilus TaxID=3053498 RepID=UPI0025770260|nr:MULTISPECIES: hypothetical protein [unclassified Variovorax]MDM0118428.1 hypothetical protein [Variovorax sp. J2L1-78]MDM0128853.1 hypothetical protein [Variovorax sp. J2L1-63]MDM0233361.1 hypothetical protein [Variovorax sp. J2R1-6]
MNGLLLIATWTGTALCIVAIAGLGPMLVWMESHERLAAWVQAIFSIVAILAAVCIATWQATRGEQNELKRQRVAASVRLGVLRGVLKEIESCCHAFRWAAHPNFNVAALLERTRRHRDVIGRLPVFELPTAEAVDVLLQAEGVLGELIEFCERYDAYGEEAFTRAPPLRRGWLERTRDLQRRCEVEIERVGRHAATLSNPKPQ